MIPSAGAETMRIDFLWLLVAGTLLLVADLLRVRQGVKRVVMAGMGWIYLEIILHQEMEQGVAWLIEKGGV